MSNPAQNLLANPVIVTGVMSSSYKTTLAANKAAPFAVCIIKHIRWVNPGASGAGAFQITDPADNHVIASGNAASAAADQDISFDAAPEQVRDFIVSTLSGGGYLEIHLA